MTTMTKMTATNEVTINIDDATYRTILLHAEKINNGQNEFVTVLKKELHDLLNVDASELVEQIKTDGDFLNRVRCYLADFPIVVTNDEGTRYHLVKFTADYCELDIIEEKQTARENVISETDDSNDNDDEVFNLLPALDELNDTDDEPTAITRTLNEEISFTAVGNERSVIIIADDVITFVNGKPHHITSVKYNAWFSYHFSRYGYHTFKDGKIYGSQGTNDEDEFFKLMAERGACTIDEPESAPEPVMTFNDIVANALEMCDELTWSLCDMHYDLTCRRYRRRGNKIRNWYLHRLIRRNAA